jgi:hypothetical protein
MEKKKRMQKPIALLLTLLFIWPVVGLRSPTPTDTAYAAEAGLQVSFGSEYAKVDEPLRAVVTGVPEGESPVFEWRVGGKLVSGADTDVYTPAKEELEQFIEVTVRAGGESNSAKLFFSRLPVVYINTENNAPIVSKEDYLDATMRMQGNDQYNKETTKLYEGELEIRGRGNTTWGQPKKPYKLKLAEKTNIMDMGKNKHWVLLANYTEESLMRNTVAYNLSGEMGMPYMQSTWVELILNGEYVGNYQFCEQIKIAKDRINIFDWEEYLKDAAEEIAIAEGFSKDQQDALEKQLESNLGWVTSGVVSYDGNTYRIEDYLDLPQLNGGFLLELDDYYDELSKFRTNRNQPINFKSPELAYTNPEIMAYVKDYIQAFEDAAYAKDYFTTYQGKRVRYDDLFDFDSMMQFWMVAELFMNCDAGYKSTYMYQDLDGKFFMGPIWDMDWSADGQGDTADYATWWTTKFAPGAPRMWYMMAHDPYFLVRAQEYYWSIRDTLLEDIVKEDGEIDSFFAYLKESGDANAALWKYPNSFEHDVQKFKSFLVNRCNWLDKQFETVDGFFRSINTFRPDAGLTLTATAEDGSALLQDTVSQYAPAHAGLSAGDAVKLNVNVGKAGVSKVAFYVNGREAGRVTVENGRAELVLQQSALTAPEGSKDVVQVRGVDASGNLTDASNYLTLKKLDERIAGIEVDAPNITVYRLGQPLNTRGMEVRVRYESGATAQITDYTLSGYDPSTLGEQEITVSYRGFTGTFQVTVVDELPPLPAPTGLSAVAGAEQIALSWQAVQGADSYNVYVDGKQYNTQPVYNTTLEITGLMQGAIYNLAVCAVDGDGDTSALSDTLAVQTAQIFLVPQKQMTASSGHYQPSDPPQNAIDGNQYSLWHSEWSGYSVDADHPADLTLELGGTYTVAGLRYLPRQDGNSNGNIVAYNIYVSMDGNQFTKVASGNWPYLSDPAGLQERIVSFAPVQARFVRLEAIGGEGNFASAAEVNVEYLQEQAAPSTPTGLEAAEVTQTSVLLRWNAAIDPEGGAVSYNVYCGGVKQNNAPISATEFTVTGLTAGKEYRFTVAAVGENGAESVQSAALAVTTPAAPVGELVLTSLRLVLTEAQEIDGNLDAYLNTGKAQFQEKYLAAKDALQNAQTQAEVDRAAEELLLSMMHLRLIPDKSALEALLQAGEAVDAGRYTAQSYASLQTAMAEGYAVLKDTDAPAERVRAAERGVELALSRLVSETDTPDAGQSGETAPSDSTDTGDGSTPAEDSASDGATVDQSADTATKTGDDRSALPYIIILAVAAVAIVAFVVVKKTTKK